MEKTTVKEIAQKYAESQSDMVRTNLVQSVVTRNYLPVAEKITLITLTLDTKILDYSDGIATYDSIDKLIYFMLSVVQGYTNMEIEGVMSDFDALMSSGLMGGLIAYIGADVDAYRDMFEWELGDALRNHNTLEAVLNNRLTDLFGSLSAVSEGIVDELKKDGIMDTVVAAVKEKMK